MDVTQTAIPDVLVLTPKVFEDERGFFMETYRAERFAALGVTAAFVQDNHSRSCRGVLRGMHYQIRQPQGKLVRVVLGEIYDAVVDLRRASPTFGKWVGARLSAGNKQQMWIPPGFAHGYYVLSDWAEIVYKATDYYAPTWERSLLWNDPQLGIQWPLVKDYPLVISSKDQAGVLFSQVEVYEEPL